MPDPNKVWLDAESLSDKRQVDSDQNSRMRHYYMSLEDMNDKIVFLATGAFDANMRLESPGTNGGFVREKKNIFSPTEKKTFMECATDFFNPQKIDGSPDYDEFEKRIDAIASVIVDSHVEQMKFMKDTDFAEFIDPDERSVPDWMKEALTKEMSRASMVRYSFQSLLHECKEDKIDPKYMEDYIKRKVEAGVIDEIDDLSGYSLLHQDFQTAFDATVQKSPEYEATLGKKAKFADPEARNIFKSDHHEETPVWFSLSKEMRAKIDDRANSAKTEIGKRFLQNKDWLYPEENITKESLEKLDNLYGQLKDADHWYHRDSKEFKEFKAALKEAHEECKRLNGAHPSYERSKELVPLFDRIASSADKYLTGKESRDRISGLGKERYDIVFASLCVTSKGKAKEQMKIHNLFREKRGSKELSVIELEDRAGRTAEQQKAHQKVQKEASKQKSASKDSKLNNDRPAMHNM